MNDRKKLASLFIFILSFFICLLGSSVTLNAQEDEGDKVSANHQSPSLPYYIYKFLSQFQSVGNSNDDQTNYIECMPDEILMTISEYLPSYRDLNNLKQTCKAFNQTFSQNVAVKSFMKSHLNESYHLACNAPHFKEHMTFLKPHLQLLIKLSLGNEKTAKHFLTEGEWSKIEELKIDHLDLTKKEMLDLFEAYFSQVSLHKKNILKKIYFNNLKINTFDIPRFITFFPNHTKLLIKNVNISYIKQYPHLMGFFNSTYWLNVENLAYKNIPKEEILLNSDLFEELQEELFDISPQTNINGARFLETFLTKDDY